jgi:putative ATP-binding cassette transporter
MLKNVTYGYTILKKYIFPWWKSEEKKVAWSGFVALVVISLISVYIAVLFTNWQRDFFNAIEKKDLHRFLHEALLYGPLVGAILFDFCSRAYLTAWLSFRWRRWSTEQLQKKWLSHKNFYKVALTSKEIDNPDQRISQDVKEVCSSTVNIFFSLFHDGINFLTFAIILWELSKDFKFHFSSYTIKTPGILLWASIAYSLFGTITTIKIGIPLIKLDRIQEKKEADFRYRLMRVFERREEIATLHGEQTEHHSLRESFRELTKNYYDILRRQIYVNLFENFYTNISLFVPLLLVGPLYFQSLITMGVLMQIQGIFSQVNFSLSSLSRQFSLISNATASFQRLITFEASMKKENIADSFLALPQSSSSHEDHEHLHIPSLTIQTPTKKTIWISPKMSLKLGDRKVLIAPSGTGKTSFLRAIAGMYPYAEEGALVIKENFMIVPQRPYMPLGTLRQCLHYPYTKWSNDDQIMRFMKEVGLEHFVKLLDQVHDYHNRLSLGEQQRMNFVRVLLHQPTWLFMDEPIAHLPKKYADSLLCLLTKNLPHSGIFIVSHQELDGFEKVNL